MSFEQPAEEPVHQNRKKRLAREWLERVVCSLESAKRERRAYNIFVAELADDAVRLLEVESLGPRVESVLEGMTIGDSLRHSLTNIVLTDEMIRRPLRRRTLKDIERKHPPLDAFYVANLLSKYDHLRHCLERDYDQAFLKARSELDLVEVVLAQAVLGDLEAALSALSWLTDKERQENVLLVAAIEYIRRNCFEEADDIRARVPGAMERDWDDWDLVHLALGVSDRAPWECYPFPDY